MKTLTAFLLPLLFFPVLAVGQNNCDTLSFFSQGSRLDGYFYPSEKLNSPTMHNNNWCQMWQNGLKWASDFSVVFLVVGQIG